MIESIMLIALSVIVLLIATYTDFKTYEVPDWLSYGFIFSALGIRLLHSTISNDWMFFVYGLIGFAIARFLGILLYMTGQWGGGDAKIMMGLGAAFATAPFAYNSYLPYLAALFFNILIAGALYGLFWSGYIFITKFSGSIKAAKENISQNKAWYIRIMLALALLFCASFLFKGIEGTLLLYFLLIIMAYLLLLVFIKSTEKAGMYERIPASKLTPGDWIAETVRSKGKIIYKKGIGLATKQKTRESYAVSALKTLKSAIGLFLGIERLYDESKDPSVTPKQIAVIKKAGVKSVLVKRGMKFLIAFLIGTIFTLIFNNAIALVFL